jgi:hypothetical protein
VGDNQKRIAEILARLADPNPAPGVWHSLVLELAPLVGSERQAESMALEVAQKRDEAAKRAEERQLQAEANERTRWRPAGHRSGKASLEDHMTAIEKAQEASLLPKKDVRALVQRNLPGNTKANFEEGWRRTPEKLKIQRGKKPPKPSE